MSQVNSLCLCKQMLPFRATTHEECVYATVIDAKFDLIYTNLGLSQQVCIEHLLPLLSNDRHWIQSIDGATCKWQLMKSVVFGGKGLHYWMDIFWLRAPFFGLCLAEWKLLIQCSPSFTLIISCLVVDWLLLLLIICCFDIAFVGYSPFGAQCRIVRCDL